MTPNPAIVQAVEQLGYRVTVGDVAAQIGLDVNRSQQGLLALASDVGGHMQVAESGEIAYQFPHNLRGVLRNKYWRWRWQEWWQKVWKVLFYIIRISFGVVLLLSIVLVFVTIAVIITATHRDEDDRDRGGGGFYMPYFWIGPDWFWVFSPDYDTYYQQQRQKSNLNFLEAVFSFLFGDGNPNTDLEDKRFALIGATIRNHQGAVTAEQIAPYLDDLGEGYAREYEDYMLPVLTRFNGQPVVSPAGQLVYHFPDLQVSATQNQSRRIPAFLQELPYRFSAANSGQIMLSIGLGALNFVGLLVLGNLLVDGIAAAEIGGLVAFVQGIYWLLIAYGTGFLVVPLVRYFWVQWRNRKISDRNQQRQARTGLLANPDATVRQKIAYAGQFAAQTTIAKENIVYSTQSDLLEQEAERSDQIDAEWQRRLSGSP
jgi:hypothetical protein